MKHGMACTPFCACQGGSTFCNKKKSVNEDSGEDVLGDSYERD